jgi:hypothetical protein
MSLHNSKAEDYENIVNEGMDGEYKELVELAY